MSGELGLCFQKRLTCPVTKAGLAGRRNRCLCAWPSEWPPEVGCGGRDGQSPGSEEQGLSELQGVNSAHWPREQRCPCVTLFCKG